MAIVVFFFLSSIPNPKSMQGKKPIIKIYIYLRKIVIHRQIEIACNEFNQKKRIGLKVYNQKKNGKQKMKAMSKQHFLFDTK